MLGARLDRQGLVRVLRRRHHLELAGRRVVRLRGLTRADSTHRHGSAAVLLLRGLAGLHVGQIGQRVERRRDRHAAVHERQDIVLEFGRRRVTVLPVLRHRLRADRIPHARQAGHERAGRRRHLRHVLIGDRHSRVAGERRTAGEHLIQHAAGRVQVGAHVDGLAASLLGREVLRGADHALGLGHRRSGVVERAGDAEVHDLDHALLGDHDVAGLDVAVDDAHVMRVFERVEHAEHHLFGVSLAERAVRLDHVTQRLALDELHHQVRQPLRAAAVGHHGLLAGVVDVDDVRVVHLRHGVRFAAESGQEDLVVGQVGAHDLDRHRTSQARVQCHAHFGHASTPYKLAELIAAVRQRCRHIAAHSYSSRFFGSVVAVCPPNWLRFMVISVAVCGVLDTRRGMRPPSPMMVSSICAVS